MEKRDTHLQQVEQCQQNLMFQAQVNAKVESYEPRIAVLEGTRSQEDTTNTTTQDVVARLRQDMDSLQASVCVFEQRNPILSLEMMILKM